MSETEILTVKTGHCGLITLDRPRALNALTPEMVVAMSRALDDFAQDPQIRTVVLRSTSARAFCAGADIKCLHEMGKGGRHEAQLAFLGGEYRNCYRISTFPKPYVSLIEGIVMGGGVGISVHGAHRVAGDSVTFAMPETGIGFLPDIGASHFLSRLPDEIGTYLAMTGTRIGLGDMLALGLATAHVPSVRFEALVEKFAAGAPAAEVIAAESIAAPPPELLKERARVARAFAFTEAAEIFAALQAEANRGSAFAATTLATLQAKSPTSVAVALRQMQFGAKRDLAAALNMEFQIAAKMLKGHDYYEGVRVTLIDKGDAPHWRPPTIAEIGKAEIDAYFEPSGVDLALPIVAGNS